MVEQNSIRLEWDQFELIKQMADIIEVQVSEGYNTELHKSGIWVKGDKENLIIIIETQGV